MTFLWKLKQGNFLKGRLGEEITARFITGLGFSISKRNYRKKWGEIDIVAVKDGSLHFIEVKSVVGRKGSSRAHFPEENVTAFKTKQIRRMIATYFSEFGIAPESPFHFHIISVYMDMDRRRAAVDFLEDIIL